MNDLSGAGLHQRPGRKHAAHGRNALVGALTRAVAFGRWKATDIGSILAAGGGVMTPLAWCSSSCVSRAGCFSRREGGLVQPLVVLGGGGGQRCRGRRVEQRLDSSDR